MTNPALPNKLGGMEVNQDQGSTRGRKSGEGQHLAEVLALYRAGDSLGVIKEKTGISVQTLSRWLKKAGVEIDPKRGLSAPRGPLSEEHRAAVSEAKAGVPITKRASWRNEVRACSRCGTEFAPTAPKQQSCSDECRLASLADRNRASIKSQALPVWHAAPSVHRDPFGLLQARPHVGQDQEAQSAERQPMPTALGARRFACAPEG